MLNESFGLVLSGGGAKGAYEAGVMKALAEPGIKIRAVSGASIGALNGAIVAAAPSLNEAAKRLEEVWMTLAETPPLQPNTPSYLTMLASAGLLLAPGSVAASWIARFSSAVLPIHHAVNAARLTSLMDLASANSWLSSTPLKQILDQYLDVESLQKGLPLHVSVYPDKGKWISGLEVALASLGLSENRDSEFMHVQSLPLEQQRLVLLASAAIPFLFETPEIDGRRYSDGGQGGWQKVQGNTPIASLLKSGISHFIVVHLSDGSLWSRHNFPEATIIEIRPSTPVSRALIDALSFSAKHILEWMEQGYSDASVILKKIQLHLAVWDQHDESVSALKASERRYETETERLSGMERLRASGKIRSIGS